MDLRQLAAAVRAHRVAAFIGLMAAVGLAFLAQVRVDPFGDPMLSYRKPVVWSSSITLRLTHAGFPEGKVSDQGSGVAGLAPLYAALATTDPVKRRMRQAGPILGGVRVDPVGTDQNMLPFHPNLVVRVPAFECNRSSAPPGGRVHRIRRSTAAGQRGRPAESCRPRGRERANGADDRAPEEGHPVGGCLPLDADRDGWRDPRPREPPSACAEARSRQASLARGARGADGAGESEHGAATGRCRGDEAGALRRILSLSRGEARFERMRRQQRGCTQLLTTMPTLRARAAAWPRRMREGEHIGRRLAGGLSLVARTSARSGTLR